MGVVIKWTLLHVSRIAVKSFDEYSNNESTSWITFNNLIRFEIETSMSIHVLYSKHAKTLNALERWIKYDRKTIKVTIRNDASGMRASKRVRAKIIKRQLILRAKVL